MVDCTTELQNLEPGVIDCKYHISRENDPDNWWYSPFDDGGVSSSYRLKSGGPGNAFERGTGDFDIFSSTTPSNIECSQGSSENWTDGVAAGKCIDVDPTNQSKLADTQPSESLSQTQCTGDNQRWINEPTAFTPAVTPPIGQHTNYEMRGCVEDCIIPNNLDSNNMEQTAGNMSFKNFATNIKCRDGFHAPASNNGNAVTPAEAVNYISDQGVPAATCAQPGSEYIVNEGCSTNCTIPTYTGGQTYLTEGYNIGEWVTLINNTPTAKAALGVDHWDPDVIGSLLQCNDGYTRSDDNDFLGVCDAPGSSVLLDLQTNTSRSGCIADCIPDPNSVPYRYDASGQRTSDSASSVATSQPPDEFGRVPWLQDQAEFSCQAGYEPGPGAMPSNDPGGQGRVVYSTPTYEHCAKLQGSVENAGQGGAGIRHSAAFADRTFMDTRKNYAVTGCYPVCEENTHICLNYSSESNFDPSGPPHGPVQTDGSIENNWRNEMGVSLTATDSNLGENNISYVRRQVLNNRRVWYSVLPEEVGKEIYEWQFKCSKDVCTMDPQLPGEGNKIDLQTLLGPDGIPSGPEPDSTWILQDFDYGVGAGKVLAENCNTTCANAGGNCISDASNPDADPRLGGHADWGVNSQDTLIAALAEAGSDVAQYCTSFRGGAAGSLPHVDLTVSRPHPTTGLRGGECVWQNDGRGTCDAMSGPSHRLCKCEGIPAEQRPVALDPAAVAAVDDTIAAAAAAEEERQRLAAEAVNTPIPQPPVSLDPVAGGLDQGDNYLFFSEQRCIPVGRERTTINIQDTASAGEAKNVCNGMGEPAQPWTWCVGFTRDDDSGWTEFKSAMERGGDMLHEPQPAGRNFSCYENNDADRYAVGAHSVAGRGIDGYTIQQGSCLPHAQGADIEIYNETDHTLDDVKTICDLDSTCTGITEQVGIGSSVWVTKSSITGTQASPAGQEYLCYEKI